MGLKRRKPTGRGAAWEGLVYPVELDFSELKIAGRCIFGGVLGSCSFGNHEQGRPPYQEPQRHLTSGRHVRLGDLLQHPPAGRARARKAAVPEWTVGDYSDAMLLTPGDYGVLDCALL